MGDDRRHGIGAAIDDISPQSPVTTGDCDAAATLFDDAEMGLSPFAVSNSGEASAASKRMGRPKGARNRKTQELVDFLLSFNRDPMMAGFDIVKLSPYEIARDHLMGPRPDGIEPDQHQPDADLIMKAAEWWRKIWSELLAYIHSKQPLAVKIEETRYLDIQLGDFGISRGAVMADAVAAIMGLEGVDDDQRAALVAQIRHAEPVERGASSFSESDVFSVAYDPGAGEVSRDAVSQSVPTVMDKGEGEA